MTPQQQKFLAELEALVKQYECEGLTLDFPHGLGGNAVEAVIYFSPWLAV